MQKENKNTSEGRFLSNSIDTTWPKVCGHPTLGPLHAPGTLLDPLKDRTFQKYGNFGGGACSRLNNADWLSSLCPNTSSMSYRRIHKNNDEVQAVGAKIT